MEDFVENFDLKFKAALKKCGIESFNEKIGVGVSGGADSVCLLTALTHFFESKNIFVITVNHNLREKSETEGDAVFVQEYCKKLNVKCFRADIERGKINSLAKSRNMGMEEAARKVRYEEFENFIKETAVKKMCLAHNENDVCETLLMRFFQGGNTEALCGIPMVRGKFIRPLLTHSRSEIELYLEKQKIPFRIDKTNFDNSMFRNTVRNKIIPCLEENISFWKKGLLLSCEKNSEDLQIITEALNDAFKKIDFKTENKKTSFDKNKFNVLPEGLKRRVLLKSFENSRCRERVNNSFMEEIKKLFLSKEKINLKGNGVSVCSEKDLDGCERIVFFPEEIKATETGFFAIIEKSGTYCFDSLEITVMQKEIHNAGLNEESGGKNHSVVLESCGKKVEIEGLEFPFAIRNFMTGDFIKDSCSNFRSVKSIFESWKVNDAKKKIPVIVEINNCKKYAAMELVCLWGALYGCSNWIVK